MSLERNNYKKDDCLIVELIKDIYGFTVRWFFSQQGDIAASVAGMFHNGRAEAVQNILEVVFIQQRRRGQAELLCLQGQGPELLLALPQRLVGSAPLYGDGHLVGNACQDENVLGGVSFGICVTLTAS